MSPRRSSFLAAAMVVAAAQGLAKVAPVPVRAKDIALVDPPMPDILPRLIPAKIEKALDARRERRRVRSDSELAIIAAAEQKRARKCANRIGIRNCGGSQ